MPRLLFEKTGNAVWMSHLDLMRLFQRAFKRAGLPLKHTQGFSPRPFVSIALPLSVGVESYCELLDFELDGITLPYEQLQQKLNIALIPGVQVKSVYDNTRHIKELAFLSCDLIMEYDNGLPDGAQDAITRLFKSDTLMLEKRTKNGMIMQNIIPMIQKYILRKADSNTLILTTCICCQNPTLNPTQLVAAMEKYIPQYLPDYVKICRKEIYDAYYSVFR